MTNDQSPSPRKWRRRIMPEHIIQAELTGIRAGNIK